MKSTGLTLALSLLLVTQVAASADGLLTGIVRDTLQITGGAVRGVGSVVGGAAGLVGDTVTGAGHIVGGTVDIVGDTVGGAGRVVSGTVNAVGDVVDGSGRVIGRVVAPGQTIVTTPSIGTTQIITTGGTPYVLGNANDVYGYSLNARRGDLGRAVSTAEGSSRITKNQAADMRADLDRINMNQINALSDGGLTFDEAVAIGRDLDRVNNNLSVAMNVTPFGQLIAVDGSGSPRFFVTTPQPLLADSSVTTRSTRSTTDSNGTTTTTTTTSNNTGTGIISSGGLYSVLDNRRYELDRRINDALIRRTIDAQRAAQLQANLDQVRTELVLDPTTGVITQERALLIARQLDTLDSSVATALNVSAMSPLTVIDTTSGTPRIVTDQFGNVIGIREAKPDIYIKTLEGRRLELENQIAAGQASGSLSEIQARSMRAELDRVAKAQANGATTFTYVNALPLAMSLDYVGNQLRTVVPTITYVPLIDGSRFVILGGQVIMLDDVMVRRAELESKISRGYATGKLSARQTETLRAELGRIGVMEEQMRAKGSLTFRDSRELYNRFDHVGSRLDGYHATGGTDKM